MTGLRNGYISGYFPFLGVFIFFLCFLSRNFTLFAGICGRVGMCRSRGVCVVVMHYDDEAFHVS